MNTEMTSTEQPLYLLRRATLSDAQGLQALCQDDDAVWGYNSPFLSSEQWWSEKIKRAENGGILIVAVCVQNDAVVAMVELQSNALDVVRRHSGTLGVCVHPSYRGQGLGRSLLQQVQVWAKDWLGITRIEVHVWATHDVALALYESVGFQREGRHTGYGVFRGQSEDAYTLAKLL